MRRDTRDALLAIEWIVGLPSLFVGGMGQAGFLSPVIKPHPPALIAVVIIITAPMLIVFTVTFFKQPFLPPRAFRFCLIVAMCSFAGLTIAAEVLCHLGYMPPDSPAYARTLSRVLMHTGWLSFVPLIRLCVIARRFERIWARRASRAVNPPDHNPDGPSESN